MSKITTAQPIWDKKRKHWKLNAYIGEKRKSFYSSDPGKRNGPAECRRKYRKALDEFEQGGSNPTFDYAWNEFIKDYKKRNKITSYNAIVNRGNAHLIKRFKRKRLSDIKKRDWQNVIFDAKSNGAKAARTLKSIASTIRIFCKYCASAGFIPDHKVPINFIIPADATKPKKTTLQPDELKLLFAEEQNDNWYIPVFRFIVLSGLRRGEVCALITNRDFDLPRITIRESLSHEGLTVSPKSKDSERSIYLSDLALTQINHHKDNRKKYGIISKYLFCKPNATQIQARQLRNEWQKWREKNGITITLHELRHTFISYSRQKTSLDLDDLKKIYGHSKDMDTDSVYVHEIKKSDKELKKELAKEKKIAKEINSAFEKIISQ